MGAPSPEAHERPPSAAAAISNMTVRTLSEYTGRGPTKARTYMQDDVISVVLRDTLTKGERSLVDDGQADHVLNTRKMFQRTMRPTLVAGVEELTGRRVIAFLSDNHLDPDIGVETFVMEPRPDERGVGDTDDATT
jgi:uncharacterized protein YbcI